MTVFLSTLSLRRATRFGCGNILVMSISIHALLAESDFIGPLIFSVQPHFYPRSPCGERPTLPSTPDICAGHFYPRSPCGERPHIHSTSGDRRGISIHALLAESDCGPWSTRPTGTAFLSTLSLRRATKSHKLSSQELVISIHALLAESDNLKILRTIRATKNFYPRSPCGERLYTAQGRRADNKISIHALLAESDPNVIRHIVNFHTISIHALLAESDLLPLHPPYHHPHFYPRSPCGERRTAGAHAAAVQRYFYPRSPCGERPLTPARMSSRLLISIHALLAESDLAVSAALQLIPLISIHALLAESDGLFMLYDTSALIFLSTLSLRRATVDTLIFAGSMLFLSTLSLRRATNPGQPVRGLPGNFYPRSPCGERQSNISTRNYNRRFLSTLSLRRATDCGQYCIRAPGISIHALLAESDSHLSKFNTSQRVFLSTLSLRRATINSRTNHVKRNISIHALLAESDSSTQCKL